MALEDCRDRPNPFDLGDPDAYEAWKECKLTAAPLSAEELIVEIRDPRELSQAERTAILARCSKYNMAIYASRMFGDPNKQIPATLGAQLGLRYLDRNMGADDDGITAIQVVNDQWRERYIPYTNRPIHWHTDGYYNGLDQQIHALLLHCVRPSSQGGETALLDHEIAYIRLRDLNPDYIQALMAPDVMTIPANIEQHAEVRPARSGPVFSVHPGNRLHMRYTAREHNIEWKHDSTTEAALNALNKLLSSDDPLIYRLTLDAGWGLICNNVLHNRSGFNDAMHAPRLLYRLRYFVRVAESNH